MKTVILNNEALELQLKQNRMTLSDLIAESRVTQCNLFVLRRQAKIWEGIIAALDSGQKEKAEKLRDGLRDFNIDTIKRIAKNIDENLDPVVLLKTIDTPF